MRLSAASRFLKIGGAPRIVFVAKVSPMKAVHMFRRFYSQQPPVKWGALENSFKVPSPPKADEIVPSLRPRFPQDQYTYSPSDFSSSKRKYKMTERDIQLLQGEGRTDKFAALKVNPSELWKSPQALSGFITTNGKIMPGWLLGNKGSTQRKLAKAIRRCRAAGLLSTVHRSVFER